MIATIRDSDILQALGPAEVAAYLRGHGWRYDREYGPNGAVWLLDSDTDTAKDDGREYELLLPVRQDLADYTRRLAEVLAVLEVVEKRSQLELVRDISDAQADVIRLRLQGGSMDDGSVPLEAATRIVQQAREMMLAAACAAVQPRAVYRSRRPEQAMEYMQGVRLGQTERGSFVLAIRSQVPPRLTEDTEPVQAEDVATEPFERRVTLKLAEALQATTEAVQRASLTGDEKPFQESVERGVSANLCDAIARMTAEGGAQALSVSVNWSPARKLVRVSHTHSLFRFTADAAPLLQEVARVFREREPYGAFELQGAVVQLGREGMAAGEVVIVGFVEGRSRRVSVTLGAEDYQKAYEAHGAGQTVSCEGELVKDGRSLRLFNPRNFIVHTDAE